jgi:phage terminase large subunit-like protein
VWTEQAERWISVDAWNACAGEFTASEMVGQPCYAGLDLGMSGDMSCAALVFLTSSGIRCLVHGWVPRDGKWRDELRNKDRYPQWEREGYLTFTEGTTTDHGVIKRRLIEWSDKYPFRLINADPAYATQLLNELYNEAMLPIQKIGQRGANLNEACVKRGTTGLVYPDKSMATERIDGLSALINAIAAAVADPNDRGPSVYETRGVLTV